MTATSALSQRPSTEPARGLAAVIEAAQQAAVRPTECPPPGPHQVRVRLEGCGICGSNVPVWEGRPWFDYPCEPGAPGHEGWGIVDAVGDAVQRVAPGDRVAVLSYHAFATHDIAEADQVVKLPSSLDGVPLPGEALGCAMNVFERSNIRPGENVAVVGVGFLGALLIQLASSAGARVLAASRRPFSLEVARRCGADVALQIGEEALDQQLADFTENAGFDCAIEAAGAQASLDLAAGIVGTRGRLVVAGFHQDGPRTVDMQSWNWRGIDVINAHERDPRVYVRGIAQAIDAVAEGRLDIQPLLTHALPLERVGDALQLAATRPEGFLKAWIRCT